jgi:hypothetical protein
MKEVGVVFLSVPSKLSESNEIAHVSTQCHAVMLRDSVIERTTMPYKFDKTEISSKRCATLLLCYRKNVSWAALSLAWPAL